MLDAHLLRKTKSLTAQACHRVGIAHSHHTFQPRYSVTVCSSTFMGAKWRWRNIGVWLHFCDASKAVTSTSRQLIEEVLISGRLCILIAFPIKEVCSNYSRTPLILTLAFRFANYPDRLDPPGKFVENSTKLTCPESDRVQYSVMASTTSNQAWSKGFDADTYCER